MTRQLDPDQLPGTPGGNGLICAECFLQETPYREIDDWCTCGSGQQCRGPCRLRAHHPESCPFRQAYVPLPIRWRQVQVGDVIQAKSGALLLVIGRECGGPWRLHVEPAAGVGWLSTQNPDHPVPVLVPYAERAALVKLRNGGLNPTMDRGSM